MAFTASMNFLTATNKRPNPLDTLFNSVSEQIPSVLHYMNTVIINALANRGNEDRKLPNCGVCRKGPHLFEDCPELQELKTVSRGFGRLFVAVRKFIDAVNAIDNIPSMTVSNLQEFSEDQLDSLNLNSIRPQQQRQQQHQHLQRRQPHRKSTYLRNFSKRGPKEEQIVSFVSEYPAESTIQIMDATNQRISSIEQAIGRGNGNHNNDAASDDGNGTVNSIERISTDVISNFCRGSG